VAPELEGAEELIRWASSNGVAVEIGHSAATYEQAMKAIEWGATLATHLFNAMSPLHHRDPGIPGAVLMDPRVTCELIADLGHVAGAVVKLACAAKGADGINLISDSCTAAGVSDGEYTQPDGRKIFVKDGLARLENGTIMGSASSILDGVRNLVSLGIDLAVAVGMASTNPARCIGLSDRGVIATGKRADLAVLDKNLHVQCTFVGGKPVYEAKK
ncbi:MAG: amidohydrolase family protein, partial [bacterium]|nr:amidohydrolase family protein [bacterium]